MCDSLPARLIQQCEVTTRDVIGASAVTRGLESATRALRTACRGQEPRRVILGNGRDSAPIQVVRTNHVSAANASQTPTAESVNPMTVVRRFRAGSDGPAPTTPPPRPPSTPPLRRT